MVSLSSIENYLEQMRKIFLFNLVLDINKTDANRQL